MLKNALNTGKQVLNAVAGGQNGQNDGGTLGQLKNALDVGKKLLGGTTGGNGQHNQQANNDNGAFALT